VPARVEPQPYTSTPNSSTSFLLLLGQATDRQVVVALPQGVVLEVKQSEARIQLFGDSEGSAIVPCCDAVHRQARLERTDTDEFIHVNNPSKT
jgi:hypothetical protein